MIAMRRWPESGAGRYAERCMVLFALTKHGLTDMFNLARGRKITVWVNQGLLDDVNLERLRAEGFDLTNFTRWIDPAVEVEIQQAIWTIKDHHPGDVLYVEHV